MSEDCPECGKSFKNQLGVSSHYGQVHEGSIAGVTITCDWCGKKKKKGQKKKRNDHEFCSRKCYGNWRSANLSGEDSAAWENRRITIECDWCGENVRKHAINVEKAKNSFCNRECASKWKSENIVKENNPVYNPEGYETVNCANCSKEIEKRVEKVNRNDNNFCNVDCYGEYISDHRRGENHPRWVDDLDRISYGGSWTRKRRERLQRDGHKCIVCEKSNAQEKADRGKGLHVHHIIKAKNYLRPDGSLDEEMAHRLENLITLCHSCHQRWEGIPLRPEVEK